MLHLFEDTARVLIDQHDGNAEKALQVALAYCSGHYKHKLAAKSLLNGQEGMTTVRLSVSRGILSTHNAYNILKKYWDPRVCDGVRNMKNFKDGSGVVFDIRSENFDGFIESFERLKETGDRIDFELQKCSDLPDLEEEGGYGAANWRQDNRNDGGFGRGGG